MAKYLPTIGMEVHLELATKTKMFCTCLNGMGQEKEPNKNICPVCTAQPGTLPVPNAQAIDFVIGTGLALNCHIARESKFDRKNYFYPDLPKGYQISQFDQPFCENGFLDIDLRDEKGEIKNKKIRIRRIHLEEDTGKLIHQKGQGETLVDFNRAGVPLMELVTEPDLDSSAQAKKFCEELRLLFRYLEISPADMEKGQMRCEANISLFEEGGDPLSGTKVELKNLNSFKAVERGIEYEIKRQSEILSSGGRIIQETRGWNENRSETFSQREKEESHDYRYFPEPDILPLKFTEEAIDQIFQKLPELPAEKRRRLIEEYSLKLEDALVLSTNKKLVDYFENVSSELIGWMNAEKHRFNEVGKTKLNQLAANYLLTEIQKHLFIQGQDIESIKITPENFAELITILYEGKINSSAGQVVIKEMFDKGSDPSHIIEEKNLAQNSDKEELSLVVEKIIEAHAQSVADYRAGKENAIKFLMGQVMKVSGGKANPQLIMEILKERLGVFK